MEVGATAKMPLLLESGSHLSAPRGSKQPVRIEGEGDLPLTSIADVVVDSALEHPAVHDELLAAIPDLKGVEVEGSSVSGTAGVVLQAQNEELGRRALWNSR